MALSPVLAYKCRAAALGLAIFVAFSFVLAFLTARVWYPDYLFWTDGGLQGLRIVLMVDFVLGPVLALVFFHPDKSRGKLLFDVVVISSLQLAAMAGGTWLVWSQRPVAIVYGNHRFVSVAPDIMGRQGETAISLARFSGQQPPYVFRRLPANALEEQRQMTMLIRYAFHPESHAFLFAPLRDNLGRVFEQQAAMGAWVRKEQAAAWREWGAGRSGDDPAQYRLAFFEGRYGNALLVFTPAGDYAGYLDLEKGLLPFMGEKGSTPPAPSGAGSGADGVAPAAPPGAGGRDGALSR